MRNPKITGLEAPAMLPGEGESAMAIPVTLAQRWWPTSTGTITPMAAADAKR